MMGKLKLPMIALLALMIASCGDSRLHWRYQAEKALWHAAQARKQLPRTRSQHPGLLALAKTYETVWATYGQDSVEDPISRELQFLSGRACLGAVKCYLAALDTSSAWSLIERAGGLFADVPEIAGELAWKRGELLEAEGAVDRALDEFEFAVHAIPPDPGAESAADSVLRLPLRMARLALLAADSTRAARVVSDARHLYMQSLAADSLDVQRQSRWYLAELEHLTGHPAEASRRLVELESMVSRDHPLDFEPVRVRLRRFEILVSKWFASDAPLDSVTPLLKDLIDDYSDRDSIGQALWALGCAARDRGSNEDALRLFGRIRLSYHRARITPRAMLARARLFDRLGKWHDAYLEYQLLKTEYPLSPSGLEAPIEMAHHYERNGQPIAARKALMEALDQYEDLRSRYPSGPHTSTLIQCRIRVYEELGEHEAVLQDTLRLSRRFAGTSKELELLVRAARIARERVADPDSEPAILGRIVERFPQTRVGAWARRRLGQA